MKHKKILLLQPQHNHALRIVYAFWRQKKVEIYWMMPKWAYAVHIAPDNSRNFLWKIPIYSFVHLLNSLVTFKIVFFHCLNSHLRDCRLLTGNFLFSLFFFVQLLMLLGDIEIQNRRFNIAFFLFELREKKQKIFQFHIGNCKNKIAKLMNLF